MQQTTSNQPHNAEPTLLDACDPLRVFALTDEDALVQRICKQLGVPPAKRELRTFADGEHKLRPLDSVRNKDVYIVGSLYGDGDLSVNDKLVRLLMFIATLRDHGADRVTAVVPYLCYARKDARTKPSDPVSSRYVAQLFEAVGTSRVVCLDVHNPAAYENAFRIPAELLSAAPVLADAFLPFVEDADVVVVSPDPGGVKRAERFRAALERRLRRPVAFAFVEKSRSEGVVQGGTVVGNVEGRVAVLVDDLINRGTTLALAAEGCLARGARKVYAAVAHGLFSPDAGAVLARSGLTRILVLDTVPLPEVGRELLEPRVHVVESAPRLACAIGRLHGGGPLTVLEE